MSDIESTLYPARLVRTMDPSRPTAKAVLVRGDRIRAVGTVDELRSYGVNKVDEQFADKVIFPGMVEAHAHAKSGGMWANTYVGFFPRTDPSGRTWPGCTTVESVLDRLHAVHEELPEGEMLQAWGLDPIYFPGERLDRTHLDRVSTNRPIHIAHVNGHIATANSALLRLEGIDSDCNVEGVMKDSDGNPNGELREPPAMALVTRATSLLGGEFSEDSLRGFARDARNHGVTTAADLGNPSVLDPELLLAHRRVAESDDFPLRLSLFYVGGGMGGSADVDDASRRLADLRPDNTDKVFTGGVKLFLDGSIQGYTARLQEPGYLGSDSNGIWLSTPETFYQAFRSYHRSGALIHVHCNGDEATELFLDTAEAVLEEFPRLDHRHTITHSQLSTPAQYRRMSALGVCANIFSNHIWYWGDQHRDIILGPDRAARMDAANTALSAGVNIAFHCDTPVTPLDPLATASYAAERRTPSGSILGEHERIDVPAALRAVTLGAAYMLKLDHLVGSIEAGKFADFSILDRDPFVSDAPGLREITVHGSVVGGRDFTSEN
ncbi:MAG: amidohydrolase [Brevibacterium sp.]